MYLHNTNVGQGVPRLQHRRLSEGNRCEGARKPLDGSGCHCQMPLLLEYQLPHSTDDCGGLLTEPHRDCDSFIWFVFVNTRVEFGNYYENSNRYCWMNECILRLNFVVAAPIPLNVWVSVELPQTLPSAVQGAGLCCVRPMLIYTD